MSGTDQQPVVFPGKEAIGCNTFCVKEDEVHTFNVEQCDSQVNSEIHFVEMRMKVTGSMKFNVKFRKVQS
jgi:hypothetical protein